MNESPCAHALSRRRKETDSEHPERNRHPCVAAFMQHKGVFESPEQIEASREAGTRDDKSEASRTGISLRQSLFEWQAGWIKSLTETEKEAAFSDGFFRLHGYSMCAERTGVPHGVRHLRTLRSMVTLLHSPEAELHTFRGAHHMR